MHPYWDPQGYPVIYPFYGILPPSKKLQRDIFVGTPSVTFVVPFLEVVQLSVIQPSLKFPPSYTIFFHDRYSAWYGYQITYFFHSHSEHSYPHPVRVSIKEIFLKEKASVTRGDNFQCAWKSSHIAKPHFWLLRTFYRAQG